MGAETVPFREEEDDIWLSAELWSVKSEERGGCELWEREREIENEGGLFSFWVLKPDALNRRPWKSKNSDQMSKNKKLIK